MQSQCSSQYIKAKVNTSHLVKKMEQARNAFIKLEKHLVMKGQELAEVKQQMEELERSWSIYEHEAREKGVSRERDIELNEDQVCPNIFAIGHTWLYILIASVPTV